MKPLIHPASRRPSGILRDGRVGCRIARERARVLRPPHRRGHRLVHLAGMARRGLLRWYGDPLPTNCVADGV